MADWSKPTLTSTYTAFVTEVKDRDVEAALWFEGMSPTNLPTNAKRLNTSTGRFEKWNGTAWVDAVATFTFPALSVAGVSTFTGVATFTVNPVMNGGTANGVPFLNSSKALTTGTDLTFDGTNFGIGTPSPSAKLTVESPLTTTNVRVYSALTGPGAFYSGFEVARAGMTGGALMRSYRNTAIGGVGWEWLTTSVNGEEISGSYTSRLILDNFGNIGVSQPASAWSSGRPVIEFGGSVQPAIAFNGNAANGGAIWTNAYFDGNNRYKADGTASRLDTSGGSFSWFIAPSGPAGSVISFGDAKMLLNLAGNLAVGFSAPFDSQGFGRAIDLRGSTGSSYYSATIDNTTRAYFATYAGGAYLGSETNHPLIVRINNTERARLDTGGNMIAHSSVTGYWQLPRGTTAQRPAGAGGMIRFNSDLNKYEGHNGTAWSSIGGGATGGGTDDVFHENGQTVTTNYTLTTNKNAMSAGPITIASGITVTVPSGGNWVVV